MSSKSHSVKNKPYWVNLDGFHMAFSGELANACQRK